MVSGFSLRNPLLGLAAGLLAALVSLGFGYIAGVITIAIDLKEFLPTLLAATTVLPLMLLFTLLIPTIIIGWLVGLTLALTGSSGSRVYPIGAIAGLIFGLAILRGLLPLIFGHSSDDFISIITRPFVSGIYALFLGLMTALFFHRFSKP
jgi:hypothetical protein